MSSSAPTRDPPHRVPSQDATQHSHRPSSAPSQEDAIFDLSFTIESRYRPFELIANEVGSADAPTHEGLQLSRTGPEAPFCAVEATVAGSSGKVLLGLAVEDGDHVLGWYDADSRRVGIDVRSGGRTRTIRRRKVDLPHVVPPRGRPVREPAHRAR